MRDLTTISVTVALLSLIPMAKLQAADSEADQQFQSIADDYVDRLPALFPVTATGWGDHRYDDQLDHVNDEQRQKLVEFGHEFQKKLAAINFDDLSPSNQVDYSLLHHELEKRLWEIETLQEWAWNPLRYTGLAGNAIYSLMARDFAPRPERLENVAARLEQVPRFLEEVRGTLQPARVPRIHAETAARQNAGVLTVVEEMVRPHLQDLPDAKRQRLEAAIEKARASIEEHQKWLDDELIPKARGNFRIGAKLYDQKLAHDLFTPLSRADIRLLADARIKSLHKTMYRVAQDIYKQQFPTTKFRNNPSPQHQRDMIRSALELAYADAPPRDGVIAAAKQSLELTTAFVEEHEIVDLMRDPLEIIVMPEFEQGVALAYCNSPGPLDVGQKTFYAVSPIPDDWTEQQANSFLREYNTRSLHVLTIHEAMPGHFLQLAHANRFPGTLRHLLGSGVFIEGWAIYSESMMWEQGFLKDDPLMHLILLKWFLRDVMNAVIDQEIQAGTMNQQEALKLLMEEAFQEEREAAAKWRRAQLTSVQLSEYFVGYLEIRSMRREAEEQQGENFNLKDFHNRLLSFGSPPPQFVEALLFDEPVPAPQKSAQ